MSFDFQTNTHGKWILAGEHAVLRGYPALVFPLATAEFKLSYQKTDKSLKIQTGNQLCKEAVQKALQRGYKFLNQAYEKLSGNFFIESSIPMGGGMGASAALCVAVARWFANFFVLPNNLSTSQFACLLENEFHGKSSGVDIAGAEANSCVLFQQSIVKPIQQAWNPHWYISYSGKIGVTEACIKKVTKLYKVDEPRAIQIDKQMEKSVNEALMALKKFDEKSLPNLANAIKMAAQCFFQWDLIDESLQLYMQSLQDAGAIAVKPTGSGGGGYVISLWKEPPPISLQTDKKLRHL